MVLMSKPGGCFLEPSSLQTRHDGGVLLDKSANATWAQTAVQGFEKTVIIVEGSGAVAHAEEGSFLFMGRHARTHAHVGPSEKDLWMLK